MKRDHKIQKTLLLFAVQHFQLKHSYTLSMHI
jgi:hypothetical protein